MGHYSSTIPGKSDILDREDELFDVAVETILDVNLNVDYQLGVLHELSRYDRSLPTRIEAYPATLNNLIYKEDRNNYYWRVAKSAG